jgi:hypothetical protein
VARSAKTKLFLTKKLASISLPSAKGFSKWNRLLIDKDKALLTAPEVDLHAWTKGPSVNAPKVLLNDKGVSIQTADSKHSIKLQTKDFTVKIDKEKISLLGKTGGGGIEITKSGEITIAAKSEIILKAPTVKTDCCMSTEISGNLKVGGMLDHGSMTGQAVPPPVTPPPVPPVSTDMPEDTAPDDTSEQVEQEEEGLVKNMIRFYEEEAQKRSN